MCFKSCPRVGGISWAFKVLEDAYDRDTHTRTILKIKKVYDVSAVSYPANSDTEISARSFFDGVIEAERRGADRGAVDRV